MSIWLLIAGIAILILIVTDILVTALSGQRAGFITWFVTSYASKLLTLLQVDRSPFLMRYTGLLVTILMFMTWALSIWIGNFLIFLSDPESVINYDTKEYATAVEKLYYVGYTISTLGYGDFVPHTDGWRIYAAILSLSGLAIMTIAITYLVPVLGALSESRILAISINNLGRTPTEIVSKFYHDDPSMEDLLEVLERLDTLIITHAQSHTIYPVLNYYKSYERSKSAPLQLAKLDEVYTILLYYFKAEKLPHIQRYRIIYNSIENYLDVMENEHIDPEGEPPPPPDLAELRRKGLPVKDTYQQLDERTTRRRCLLKASLHQSKWSWNDIYSLEEEEDG